MFRCGMSTWVARVCEGCKGHGRSEMLQANDVHPFSTAHYEIMHSLYPILPTRGRALLHTEQRRAVRA
jgi:hypothetical protein